MTAEHSFWFGRFQAWDNEDGFLCRDWLRPGTRTLPRDEVAGLEGPALSRALFERGFVPACESSFPAPVGSRPTSAQDLLFWQYPCRTEGAAFDVHCYPEGKPRSTSGHHCYVGLPWATWIDKLRVDSAQEEALHQTRLVAVRLSGLRRMLASWGVELRVHTVCQHIEWRRVLAHWRRIGITDAWLSHAPPAQQADAMPGVRLHPWHLYAVNARDPARRQGLQMGKDPSEKPLLASFVGTHMPHYLSDSRLRLLQFAGEPGFHVQVPQEQWHFEEIVYGHQVHGRPERAVSAIDPSVRRYNELLSDSVFSLCPAGAGPNTLRLWESLAVGSIPVLLGPQPRLPEGGTLPVIDWDAIVVRVPDDQLQQLPELLRRMPLEERRRRQRQGMAAYALVEQQRCFAA